MRTTMKALVSRSGLIQVEERAIPIPGPEDVVVRTTAASLCSADVAASVGEFDTVSSVPEAGAEGIVLGHEAVGIVHAVGELVSGFRVGERVMSASTTPCGRCDDCQRGYGGHCGGTAWGGYTAGITRDGTLAEYYVVPHARDNLTRIPDGVSDAGALLVTDTLASGSSGIDAANIPLGGVVVVFGQGHIGLGAIMTAKLRGAGLVIAVRASAAGSELAVTVGADVALNLVEHDVLAEIRRRTGGAGADCCVEASGSTTAFSLAVAATRWGGEVSVIATYSDEESLTIPLQEWGGGIGDKKILSTFQLAGRERMTRLLRLVESGKVPIAPLFTHEYTFDEVERAFGDMRDRSVGVMKPFIRFPDPYETGIGS